MNLSNGRTSEASSDITREMADSRHGGWGRVRRLMGSVGVHVAMLVVALIVLGIPRWQGPADLRYDAGVYYVLGTSLATGQGYRLISEPGSPRAVQYPPGLPALVAAHQWAAGTSDPAVVGRWLKATMMVLWAAFAVMGYLLTRRLVGERHGAAAGAWCGLAVGALCVGCFWSVFLSGLCFAELPFAVVSLAALLLAGRSGRLAGVAQGVCVVTAYLLRTAGVALMAAWVIEAAVRRRWRAAAVRAVVAAVPVIAWQTYVSGVRASPEYVSPAYEYQRAPYQYYNVTYAENLSLLDPFRPELGLATSRALVKRTARHVLQLPLTLGETVSAPRGFWAMGLAELPGVGQQAAKLLGGAALAGLGGIVAVGLVLLLRRGEVLLATYAAMSVGLVCLTPWPEQFLRYTHPLTPVLGAAGLVALNAAGFAGLGRAGRWVSAAVRVIAVVSVAGGVGYTLYVMHAKMLGVAAHDSAQGRATQRLFFYDGSWTGFDEAMAYLGRHARPGNTVATSAPHRVFLNTGLPAVQPPFVRDAVEAERLLAAVPVRYVLVDAFDYPGGDVSRRYSIPALAAGPGRWREVFRTADGGTRVFERGGRESGH